MGGGPFLGTLAAVFLGLLIVGTLFVASAGWLADRVPGDFTIVGLNGGNFLHDIVAGVLGGLIDGSKDGPGVPHATPVVAFALFGLALLGVLGWFALRRMRGDGAVQLFVLSMLGMALLLSAGVEIAALDGDIQRMNTVFKFYLHVWILLGVSSAFGVWYVLDVVQPKLPVVSIGHPELRLGWVASRAFALVAAGLLLTGLVYPVVATRERVQDRFENEGAQRPRTDDGLAYMPSAQYGDEGGTIDLGDDYAAIQWLRENVQGSPTIIEALTPLYRWGSRISINTGLPAVLGWDWHQTQQRGSFDNQVYIGMIQERQQDVRLFYATSDPEEAQDVLKKYDVRYVILGRVEQLYYPEEGMAKFDSGLGGMLRQVFQSGQTRVFEVVRDQQFVSH